MRRTLTRLALAASCALGLTAAASAQVPMVLPPAAAAAPIPTHVAPPAPGHEPPVVISSGSACGPNGCGPTAIAGDCGCAGAPVAAPAKRGGFRLFGKKSAPAAACGCGDQSKLGNCCATGCEPFQQEGCSTPHQEGRFILGGCKSFFGCRECGGSPYGNAPRPVTTPCDYGTYLRW